MRERKFYFDSPRGAKLRSALARRASEGEACLPPSAAGRARVVDGLRRCYAAARLPWHGNVHWIGSPLAAAVTAAGCAATLSGLGRYRLSKLPRPPRRWFASARRRIDVRRWWRSLRAAAPQIAVRIVQCALIGPLIACTCTLFVSPFLQPQVPSWVWWTVGGLGALFAFDLFVGLRSWLFQRGQAYRAQQSHHFAVLQLRAAVVDPLADLLQPEDREVVNFELRRANSLDELTARLLWRTPQALRATHATFTAQVSENVTRVCLPRLKPGETLGMRPGIGGWIARQWESSYLSAYRDAAAGVAWLAREGLLALEPELREKLEAYLDASSAGFWWPHRDFVIVCESPIAMYLEGDEERRLHRLDGPAVRWSDGSTIHASHGDLVDASVLEREHSLAEIEAMPDGPNRRAAIERKGWSRYIVEAELPIVDLQPDPGNPPHLLALHEAPSGYVGVFRLLSMINGSPNTTERIVDSPSPCRRRSTTQSKQQPGSSAVRSRAIASSAVARDTNPIGDTLCKNTHRN